MSGNNARVELDLNYPAFQDELFDLDVAEMKRALKTFKKLRKMSWNDVFRDQGLNWERIRTLPGKYSIRLSISCRAVVVREGVFMRFQSVHPDHDGAYR